MSLMNRMARPHTQAGTWLADGWCATVYAVIGDNDYKRDVMEMINISKGTCNYCPGNKSTCPWFDFQLCAKWAQRMYKPYELACKLIRKGIGLSSANVFPDWMHDKYLGTDKVQKNWSCSLKFLCSYDLPHTPLNLTRALYGYHANFFFIHVMGVYVANPGRSSMAPSCTCLFICLCRSEIQPRIWMSSGNMSSACTRNSEFLTGSVPSRWQCSPQKVEFQIYSISDSESAWVVWVPLSISVLQCLMLVLINSCLWW